MKTVLDSDQQRTVRINIRSDSFRQMERCGAAEYTVYRGQCEPPKYAVKIKSCSDKSTPKAFLTVEKEKNGASSVGCEVDCNVLVKTTILSEEEVHKDLATKWSHQIQQELHENGSSASCYTIPKVEAVFETATRIFDKLTEDLAPSITEINTPAQHSKANCSYKQEVKRRASQLVGFSCETAKEDDPKMEGEIPYGGGEGHRGAENEVGDFCGICFVVLKECNRKFTLKLVIFIPYSLVECTNVLGQWFKTWATL